MPQYLIFSLSVCQAALFGIARCAAPAPGHSSASLQAQLRAFFAFVCALLWSAPQRLRVKILKSYFYEPPKCALRVVVAVVAAVFWLVIDSLSALRHLCLYALETRYKWLGFGSQLPASTSTQTPAPAPVAAVVVVAVC